MADPLEALQNADPKPRRGRMSKRMAETVVRAYAKTGMNATEAARIAGYSESTAQASGYNIVNVATKRLLETAAKEKKSLSLTETKTVIEVLGLTPIEAITEYLKILGQDRDMATKLKALAPLMSALHAGFSTEENSQKAPAVSITVENNVDTKGEIDSVAQSTLSDTVRDVEVNPIPSEAPTEDATSPAVDPKDPTANL